jgi:hypothetical protein
MKIVQLLSGWSLTITNEEKQLIKQHPDKVKISSLSEREQIVAHNLVKKGYYSISNDNLSLINQCNETNF